MPCEHLAVMLDMHAVLLSACVRACQEYSAPHYIRATSNGLSRIHADTYTWTTVELCGFCKGQSCIQKYILNGHISIIEGIIPNPTAHMK